jgi:acyl dehydratase
MLTPEAAMNSPLARDDAAYEVRAFNTAAASENKIHDDAVARRFGFHGALVPGVEVYAYMAHMPVARWGRAWLESGAAECRFRKPVYDGASGHAFMPSDRRPAPAVDVLPASTPPAERPPANEAALAPGSALGIRPLTIDRTMLANYLDDIGETDPLYRAEGLVHPGQILRLANQALVQNVVLGPWIHVGSKVRNHAAARAGEQLTIRSRVISNAVNKGHAIVEFDAIVIADGARAVAEISHAAIWRPRQVAEGS